MRTVGTVLFVLHIVAAAHPQPMTGLGVSRITVTTEEVFVAAAVAAADLLEPPVEGVETELPHK